MSYTYMSIGTLPTPHVKVHMDVNKVTYVYVRSQVLAVVNTETTIFLGVMWHGVDRYTIILKNLLPPSYYTLLFPAFLLNDSLFFCLLTEQLH